MRAQRLGTTALGALDDVEAIAPLCADHGVRLHVDAAYGGFRGVRLRVRCSGRSVDALADALGRALGDR